MESGMFCCTSAHWSSLTLGSPASYCVGRPFAAKTALTHWCMDSTRLLKPCCGMWLILTTDPLSPVRQPLLIGLVCPVDAQLDWDLGSLETKPAPRTCWCSSNTRYHELSSVAQTASKLRRSSFPFLLCQGNCCFVEICSLWDSNKCKGVTSQAASLHDCVAWKFCLVGTYKSESMLLMCYRCALWWFMLQLIIYIKKTPLSPPIVLIHHSRRD